MVNLTVDRKYLGFGASQLHACNDGLGCRFSSFNMVKIGICCGLREGAREVGCPIRQCFEHAANLAAASGGRGGPDGDRPSSDGLQATPSRWVRSRNKP